MGIYFVLAAVNPHGAAQPMLWNVLPLIACNSVFLMADILSSSSKLVFSFISSHLRFVMNYKSEHESQRREKGKVKSFKKAVVIKIIDNKMANDFQVSIIMITAFIIILPSRHVSFLLLDVRDVVWCGLEPGSEGSEGVVL